MSRTARSVSILVLALTAGASSLRAEVDGQLRRLPPGAALLGQVVDADSGRGLDRAVVSIASASLTRSAVVDSRGRFLFSGLPAGEYTLTASRSGFLNGAFGQRRAGGTYTPLHITTGQWLASLDIPLWRPGLITGDVRDHTGDPIEGLTVTAYRRDQRPTFSRLTAITQTTTDDTGNYRLTPLPPGDYVVGVGADDEVWFAPEYYPSTPTPSMASAVSVAAGRELGGVNFMLPIVDGPEVSGQVERGLLHEAQWPALRVSVGRRIDADTIEPVAQRIVAETIVNDDGTFSFPRVPPGDWVLEAYLGESTTAAGAVDDADGSAEPARVWASVPISVGARPLRDVQVHLQPALSVRGNVRTIPATRQGRTPAGLSVAFVPVFQQARHERITATVGAEGTFSTANVLVPQRYLLEVSGLPEGWRLAGIFADGVDVSNEPLDLTSGRIPLAITIEVTDQLTVLAGTVRGSGALGDATATVLVFPREGQDRGERRFRSARVSFDGTFVIRDLPPGDYRVVAIDDAESAGWIDRARLSDYAPRATAVTLRAGEARIIELRRIPQR